MNVSLKRGWVGVFAAIVITAGAAGLAAAQDAPDQVITYRQNVMKSLGAHTAAIAAIVRGQVGYTDHIADHAEALHAMSVHLVELFPEGSGSEAGTTRALAAIWQDRERFDSTAEQVVAETARLVEVARDGDATATAQQFAAMGRACAACHETFRAEQ